VTTVSDIVPQAVLVRIANRIARSARQFARRTKSSRIPRAIKVGNVSATQQTASISIILDTNIAPQAMIFEKGAKAHPINARNVPNLIFEGTNAFAGQIIKTPHVDHPGMRARPFLQPAKDSTRERNRQDIRDAVGRNLRLVVRGMAKKV
jgi:hypothetical protein